jgi:hypothetical protein
MHKGEDSPANTGGGERGTAQDGERFAVNSPSAIDPYKLEPMIPVLTCSKILRIGKDFTYKMIKNGTYPVPVHEINGRFKVSKYDLLNYLGIPVSPVGAA